MGQHTFRHVVKPKQLLVTTDLAGVLAFTDRATSFKVTSGQSLPLVSTTNTEHLIEGQSVEIWNAGTSDILIDPTLMQAGISIDIEPGTSSILIWTSTGLFVDLGGSALIKDVEDDLATHVTAYDIHEHNGTDTPKVEGINIAHSGASENDMLRLIGGTLQWNNPFDGPQSDFIQLTSTDTTTNLNAITWAMIPINGMISISPHTSYLASSGNGVQVNFTGRIKIRTNLHVYSSTARTGVKVAFAINGNKIPGIGSCFCSGLDGHDTSSIFIEKSIGITSGDIITLMSEQNAGTGNVTLISGESFLEVEIPADSMSEGPVGATGYSGWDHHYGSIVPSVALGVDGDVYLQTSTGDYYKKESGIWNLIANFLGPAGVSGGSTDLVFSERNGNLSDNALEWSFGDGSISNGSVDFGITMHKAGEITAMTFNAETAGNGTTTIEVLVNGASVSRSVSANANIGKATADFTGNTVPFALGDTISFRTVLSGGAGDARVSAIVEFA